jgi:hypothetical protein
MCRTAFCVLVERAAKFADDHDRKLEIFFEEAGKKEDRAIIQYMRTLKAAGNPFNEQTSGVYAPLSAEDYRRIVLGGPPAANTGKFTVRAMAEIITLWPRQE